MKKIMSTMVFLFLTGCSSVNPNVTQDVDKINQTDIEYYESFRNKCKNDSKKNWNMNCCLGSVDRAEKENSKIFESNNGGMSIGEQCSEGYSLGMYKCETSYIWCEKNN